MFDQQNRSIVSVEDPALDRLNMDVAKYGRTRDPSLVRLLPGQTARTYVVRRLTRGENEFVNGIAQQKRAAALIALCLLRVEEPNGTHIVPTKQIPSITGRTGTQLYWNDEPGGELDALYDRMGWSEWCEIVTVIEAMAGMKLGEAYGSSDERFSLPLPSQAALARIDRLRAAQTRTESPT